MKGGFGASRGASVPPIPVPSVGPALRPGYRVKLLRGLGLVVHFPFGYMAKINTP